MATPTTQAPSRFSKIVSWFDTHAQGKAQAQESAARPNQYVIPWPFLWLNFGVVLIPFVGFSWTAVGVAGFLYFIRMFGITGVYHRYFSHRTYKTSRTFQFFLAMLGNSAGQRGPLWWPAHHRHHHAHSDEPSDIHSPKHHGFWNAHMLWWSRRKNIPPRLDLINDYAKFPELVFLDRFDSIVPMALGGAMLCLGAFLHRYFPQLGTSAMQMFTWGFVVSTVALFHGVATINSLSHVYGRRRFATTDTSRNNWLLAIITLGEGWHNNHHHYCNSTRQGFYWWEYDVTYYMLKGLAMVGLVWDLKPVPERILHPRPVAVRPHEVVPALALRAGGVASSLNALNHPSAAAAPVRSPEPPSP
ncbi:MAG: acyl-CoA desaturase [Fibrobacteres bacterium]|nr:acyl-CoA desaturase [Fibrobacterota bacterium]